MAVIIKHPIAPAASVTRYAFVLNFMSLFSPVIDISGFAQYVIAPWYYIKIFN